MKQRSAEAPFGVEEKLRITAVVVLVEKDRGLIVAADDYMVDVIGLYDVLPWGLGIPPTSYHSSREPRKSVNMSPRYQVPSP